MKFRKRVEMACLLLAVVIAAISSSRRYTDVSPGSSPIDEASWVFQAVFPGPESQLLEIGDSLERARTLLGPPHVTSPSGPFVYHSCSKVTTFYEWYLPDGSRFWLDATDVLIDEIYVLPPGALDLLRVDRWSLPAQTEFDAAGFGPKTISNIAPMVDSQLGAAQDLTWACREMTSDHK